MRWFGLITAIILIPLAYMTGETVEAFIAFIAGAFLGLFIDYIGIEKLKLWRYPRQLFLSRKYFLIVIPAWGVFGMIINLFWIWFNVKALFMFITLGLLILYEFPNLNSKSWEYYTSSKIVIIGWFPMVILFRATFLFLPVEHINSYVRSVFL